MTYDVCILSFILDNDTTWLHTSLLAIKFLSLHSPNNWRTSQPHTNRPLSLYIYMYLHHLVLHSVITIIHQSSNIPHATHLLWLSIQRHIDSLTSQLYRNSILTNDCGNFTLPKHPCPCLSEWLVGSLGNCGSSLP